MSGTRLLADYFKPKRRGLLLQVRQLHLCDFGDLAGRFADYRMASLPSALAGDEPGKAAMADFPPMAADYLVVEKALGPAANRELQGFFAALRPEGRLFLLAAVPAFANYGQWRQHLLLRKMLKQIKAAGFSTLAVYASRKGETSGFEYVQLSRQGFGFLTAKYKRGFLKKILGFLLSTGGFYDLLVADKEYLVVVADKSG